MLSYITLIWNVENPAESDAARAMLARLRADDETWYTVVGGHGFAVLAKALSAPSVNNLYILTEGRGVALGQLFGKDAPFRLESDTHGLGTLRPHVFSDSTSTSIVKSKGRELVEGSWGKYVAFIHDPNSRTSWVLRDPTGGIPCQWTSIEGVNIYFLRVEDSMPLAARSLSVNLHYVLGYLLSDSGSVRETGLNEIETVLAGECIEHIASERKTTFHWNPLKIAQTDVIENFDEAVRLMRDAVSGCVHAWASCFDNILLRLSGGLDSSIVLACLRDAPSRPRVVCVNNYDPNAASADERIYARRAAHRAGYDLIERQLDSDFSLGPFDQSPSAISPHPCFSRTQAAQREAKLMQELGVEAVFTGFAGDEVFYRGGPLPTVVDYIWQHGLDTRVLSRAFDDAVSMRVSLLNVLRAAMNYGLFRRPWSVRACIPRHHRPLMSEEVRESASRDLSLWHPLFQCPAPIPPAKFAQAYVLTGHTARIYTPASVELPAATVWPLSSQPLIELSLRIPVYLLKSGGRDRAVARQAFAHLLPPEIVRRQTKGMGSEYLRALLNRNMGLVRSLLLDGLLTREGFVDRNALSQVLSGQPTRSKSYTLEILDYLSVEAWARSWSNCPIASRA